MTNIYELGYGLGDKAQAQHQEAEKLGKEFDKHLESERENPSSETYDPKEKQRAELAAQFRAKMERDRSDDRELER